MYRTRLVQTDITRGSAVDSQEQHRSIHTLASTALYREQTGSTRTARIDDSLVPRRWSGLHA